MPIRRFLGAFAERCLPRGMKGRGFLMRHGKTLEERYFANATNIFTEREANKILKNGCKPGIQKITKPLYDRVKGKDPVTKMQYVDLHLWLVHDILMKGDKMGMANSLEVRVPFLDKKVLELAETLPLDYKVRAPQTKVALTSDWSQDQYLQNAPESAHASAYFHSAFQAHKYSLISPETE